MTELDQNTIGVLLGLISLKILEDDENKTNECKIDADYVIDFPSEDEYLRMSFYVKSGGAGNSNPDLCRKIYKLIKERYD